MIIHNVPKWIVAHNVAKWIVLCNKARMILISSILASIFVVKKEMELIPWSMFFSLFLGIENLKYLRSNQKKKKVFPSLDLLSLSRVQIRAVDSLFQKKINKKFHLGPSKTKPLLVKSFQLGVS